MVFTIATVFYHHIRTPPAFLHACVRLSSLLIFMWSWMPLPALVVGGGADNPRVGIENGARFFARSSRIVEP